MCVFSMCEQTDLHVEPQIDNLYCVVLLNCFLSTGSGRCLRRARLRRLYEQSSGKKGRTGVLHMGDLTGVWGG